MKVFCNYCWNNIPDVLRVLGIIFGLIWLYKRNVCTTVMLFIIASLQLTWVIMDIIKYLKYERRIK